MTRKEVIVAGITGLSALAMGAADAQTEVSKESPEVKKIRALLKAHDKAFTNHDLNGVMACLARKAAIMGTGPGEIWAGPAEIRMAYERFFEGFDKGEQDFDYHFRIGDVGTDMGWLMTSGEVTGKKNGKRIAFPLNLSLTVVKEDGNWKIAAMHFSTLTEGERVKTTETT